MARSKSLLHSGGINVAAQILYLVVMYLAGSTTTLAMSGEMNDFVILLIALFPCVVWLSFFYFQDRAEPEPTGYVLAAFFVGMAVSSLLYIPIVHRLFTVGEWIPQSLSTLFLGSFFVTGALASFLFYLVIRYGFYLTKEFDEPADGMAYGAFIGSGFALVESITYLIRHSDFTLFAMAYSSSVNALVYASIGSLVGYFVGRTKFGRGRHEINSLTGIVIGTLLFGVYQIANEYVLITGAGNVLWMSFVLTLIFSIAILVAVYLEMRKLTAKPFDEQIQVPRAADPFVFILFAAFMLVGVYTKYHYTADLTFKSEKFGITFQYPRSLSSSPLQEVAFATLLPVRLNQVVFSGEDRSRDGFSLAIEVRGKMPDSAKISLNEYLGDVHPVSMYTDEVMVAGVKATRLKYGIQQEGEFRTEAFPTILWAYTDIVPTHRETFVLTYKATPAGFEKHKATYAKILNSLTITE